MIREKNLAEGKIYPTLIGFAIPVFLSMLLQALYGAVDLMVVGHFSSTADVSAVSISSNLMNSITMVVTGLSMGVTIIVGEKIGEGNRRDAGVAIGTGISVFAIVAALMTLITTVLAFPLLRLLNSPEESIKGAALYLKICGAGSVFVVGYNIVGSIFRGIGDSKTPLITVAIACVVNILGDLLLVAVFKMGAAGAAIATIAAQAISVILSVVIIRKRGVPFEFYPSDLKIKKETALKEVKLGAPLALMEFLVAVSFLVIQAIVNAFGLTTSAGMGVAQKVTRFIMLVPSSFAQSITAFTAQNMGAGKPERAGKALKYSIITSFCVGILIGYLSFFHGDILCAIFTDDSEVIRAGHDYMRSFSIDCLLTAFLFSLQGYFNGREMSAFVMIESLAGAFGVRIPVSYIMSRIFGAKLFYIGLATPCSTLVQICICLCMLYRLKKKEEVLCA